MARRWRKRILYAAIALVVVSATVFLIRREVIFSWSEDELREAIAETDRAEPNWRWDDLQANREKVPDEQNAVYQIAEVKKLVGEKIKFPEAPGYRMRGNKVWPEEYPPNCLLLPENVAELEAFTQQYDPAIQAARKIADFPRGRFPKRIEPNPYDTRMQLEEDWRTVQQLLAHDAERQIHAHELNAALGSVRAIVTSVHAFADEPSIITQIFRIGGVQIAVAKLERILAMGEAGNELLALTGQLEAMADDKDMYHGLRGERAFGILAFEFVEQKQGWRRFEQMFADMRRRHYLNRLDWWMYRPTLKADKARYLRMMNGFIDTARLPLHEQGERFGSQLDSLAPEAEDYPMSTQMTLAFEKIHNAMRRKCANLLTARVGIAVERFRQLNGFWPKLLEELPKDLLATIPRDPYSAQPLRYRRTDYGAVVYTVGLDGFDDEGNVERRSGEPIDVGFRLYDPSKRRQPAPNPPWFSDSAAHAAVGVGSGVLIEPGAFSARE